MIQGAVEKRNLFVRSIVLAIWQGQGSSHQAMGTKTDVDIFQLCQAFHEHAGARQQNQRQREFRHHEPATEMMPPGASFACATALFEVLVRVNERNLPGRPGAKNDGGSACDQRGKKKNIQIKMNVQAGGKVFWSEPQ